jgi:hypothetical protein
LLPIDDHGHFTIAGANAACIKRDESIAEKEKIARVMNIIVGAKNQAPKGSQSP